MVTNEDTDMKHSTDNLQISITVDLQPPPAEAKKTIPGLDPGPISAIPQDVVVRLHWIENQRGPVPAWNEIDDDGLPVKLVHAVRKAIADHHDLAYSSVRVLLP